MVRGFGALLVVGIVLALLCTLTAGCAALALARGERQTPPLLDRFAVAARGAGDLLAGTWHGAGRLLAATPLSRLGRAGRALTGRVAAGARAALRGATRRPERALSIGLALAALGWVADTQTEIVSDITKLVPQRLGRDPRRPHAPERDRRVGRDRRGGAGARPDVAARHALDDATTSRSCSGATATPPSAAAARRPLCPALSLPDLFRNGSALADQRVGRGAAGCRAAVLLPGGDHARPAHRDTGVRHPADAARPPAGGDRRDALGARPARRRRRAARRSAGARG